MSEHIYPCNQKFCCQCMLGDVMKAHNERVEREGLTQEEKDMCERLMGKLS